ncbi:hypothetical protein Acr_04g0008450 [Actinidia rufa]|uniref:Uncharacterized protein n=1 Tax=Actinidia rufa TaxID=165716 RepID=A0A7J0EKF3_9ERIC|nr:hypothetical protein Acr_04g0008450 [Actinidia rufa]
MSYGVGPSYQVSDSLSSSSSDKSYHEDPAPEFDMQTQDTESQWNHMMLQQQMIAQQYYLMQSQNTSLWGGSLPWTCSCPTVESALIRRRDNREERLSIVCLWVGGCVGTRSDPSFGNMKGR